MFGLPEVHVTLAMVGLFVYTFAIVTYYFPVATVGVGIGVVGLLVQRERLRVPASLWMFLLLLLWAFCTSFFSDYPELVRDQVVDRLKLVLIMLVVVNTIRSWGQLLAFSLFFVVCYVLFPVRGAIYNYAVGHHPFGRMVWNYIYGNPNDLASLCLLALGITLSVAFSDRVPVLFRRACAGSAILITIIMLMTQSRGAFLGAAVGMGLGLLRYVGQKMGRVLIAVVIMAAAIPLLPDTIWERFAGIQKLTSVSTIAKADPEGSAEQRWEIQKTAWKIFGDHPVTGVGLGTYGRVNARYAPELGPRDTHNTYLNLAAELGFPGLIIWLALVISVLRDARKSRRSGHGPPESDSYVWLERGFIGYLFASLFSTSSGLSLFYVMLGVMWCTAHLDSRAPVQAPAGRAKGR